MSAVSRILSLLFPPRCVFCGRITGGERTCNDCRRTLPYCESTSKRIEFCDKFTAPFYYKGAVRSSLLRFKFRGRRGYAPEYAAYVAEAVQRDLSGTYDVITWVPISEKRLKKRGYDQAGLIAAETAKILETKAEKLLQKRLHNPAQSSIPDKARRRANVAGAYTADRDAVRGRRILIIDDIATTGATLSECARTLLMAGAESVVCAAAASTGERNAKKAAGIIAAGKYEHNS